MWFGKLGIGLAGVLLLVVFPMAAGFETAEAETSEEVVVEQVDNYNGRDQIAATQYASLEAIPGIPYEVPEEESGAKRFMDYRTITDRTTSQWVLQQEAVTDEYGFRRYGGAYMVAMGTYYAQTCGDVFEIVLDPGFPSQLWCRILSETATPMKRTSTGKAMSWSSSWTRMPFPGMPP